MDFEGACKLDGDCFSGWVRAKGKKQPIWVELCGEGLPLGIALADLNEPDGCGFRLPIPSAAVDFSDKLEVRVANSAFILPREAESEIDESGLEGELLLDGGLTLAGWARDKSDPGRAVRLYALVDEKKIATALACKKRWRPEDAELHAFSMELPFDLADGKEHLVHVQDERGHELPGSPVLIRVVSDKVSDLLKTEPTRATRKFLAEIVQHMERRIPGAVSSNNYAAWKEAWPVAKTEGKIRCAVSLPFCGEKSKTILAAQKGLSLVSGKPDYILLMRPDDKLHQYALALMISALVQNNAVAIYADGEDEDGKPLFKSAWDKLAFWGQDYLGPVLLSSKVWKNPDLSMPYNIARLEAVLEAEKSGKILHLPQILSITKKIENDAAREGAIQAVIAKANLNANAGKTEFGVLGIHFSVPDKPRISIIIPTRDHASMLKRCVTSLEMTAWPDLEIIIADNGTEEDEALEYLAQLEQRPNFRVLRLPGVFNFSWLNNASVQEATGSIICFLNNDTEILSQAWLEEMAGLLLSPGLDAGCVGAKLLWPNKLVQHGGVILGVHELAGHVGNQWLDNDAGYMCRNQIAQQYSAVTAACMLTPKKLFLELGGFDEHDFAVNFNDVDYCMRILAMGKKIYWTPHARLLHHESASRGKDENPAAQARTKKEMQILRRKWGCYEDKFYNPNLPLTTLTAPFDGMAFLPRSRNAR